mmetsp:Transcript_5402/g.4582  ORF Transcript_5402/g.4582 Transcript_5402/m.4582 type:complete len:117 (+) Transcript_5402:590-940(+)
MAKNDKGLNPNGCGIGLTISRKYLDKLGGDINLVSKYKEGTTISFTIPLCQSVSLFEDEPIKRIEESKSSMSLLSLIQDEKDILGSQDILSIQKEYKESNIESSEKFEMVVEEDVF